MLAASAMNGALFDSTYNIFFRLKYDKLYDAMLATPMRPNDIARGEITWALLRGAIYSAAFIVVMLCMGLVAVVVDAAGAAGDVADRLRVRRCRDGADDVDAQLAGLRVHPARDHADVLVLGDVLPACRPIPTAIEAIVRWTPLYQGVVLCRELSLGTSGWDALIAVRLPRRDGARAACYVAGRRIGTLLLK